MKWLKLDDGALFNLESVMYIWVKEKSCGMITVDGDTEWTDATIRHVWAALQEPNTVVPKNVHCCVKCGRTFDPGETVSNNFGGMACVTCPPV